MLTSFGVKIALLLLGIIEFTFVVTIGGRQKIVHRIKITN